MQWYAKVDGTLQGPMTEDELRILVESGRIGSTTLLWRAGLKEWIPASQAPGVITPPQVPNVAAQSTTPPIPDGPTPADISMTLAEPWLRFWARALDNLIWISVLSFLLGMLWPSLFRDGGFFAGRGAENLLGWLVLPFAMVLDAVAFAIFGNTLGKWLAGIKILTLRGEPVPFQDYLKRNFGVYFYGLGTGFPLVSLFTLVSSHNRAKKGELMSWDQNEGTRSCTHSSNDGRLWLVAILYIAFVTLLRAWTAAKGTQ